LGGIRLVAPGFNTLFMVVVLGSVALPLTNGFIGEFLLLYGVYSYHTWLAAFAGLTIILGAVYMLRMFQITMLGNTVDKTSAFADLKWNEWCVLGVISLLIIGMGIYPNPVIELAQPVLTDILNHVN
jgi:NADH-quinone oxidoreductase subunit M